MDSLIFDVDGTLWDSTDSVAKSWTAYLKEDEHLNMEITKARLMQLFGQPLPVIAEQLFPEHSNEEQLRIIDGCCQAEHRALLREPAQPYPGLEDTLKALSAAYPLFIVSNCQAGYIEVFLKATGFGKYFKDHLCFGDTGVGKAETIQILSKRNHLKSPVYVGDTMGDFTSCRQAGVPFVFASYGFGDVPAPDYRIEKLPDLIKLFCTK